jgi:chromosome segregation ATPase
MWKKSQVDDAKNFVYVPVEEFATLLETKLKVAEQQVVLDQVREQYVSVMEEMTKRNIFLKERWAADAVHAGSKETVVEILTQKVCVLEKLVRQMQDAKEADDKAIHELRSVCAKEIGDARKELLEQTQTLKFKIADTVASTDGLQEMIAQKDREIEELKSQREFLLGLGVKSSTHMSIQTEENFS